MNGPFVEKYRPTTFDDIEGNKEVIECLKSMIKSKFFPNMLFYGPPGTGKTTCIRIIAKTLPYTSVLELNASDERGIKIVRHTIKEFASTYSKTLKLVILDEVDFMTRDAQNALRRIMEDYFQTTRFCLIANYPKKIIPPILSRCSKLRFNPITKINKSVIDICKTENIEIDNDGLDWLIKTSYGDMRKLINDIQGIQNSYGKINKNTVMQFNGLLTEDNYFDLYNLLLTEEIEIIKNKFIEIKNNKSIDLLSIITEITNFILQSDLKSKLIILKKLSEIEYRLNLGCNEIVQINALIGIFILYR
ncbi:replication factor c subunit 5 [Vairimorpha apis BRL 01]|uniref:Replication factor c subunit 5 n=1 Tax=Vairimorpha apis BRL 01 TaxID=1037528 RepID=T0L5S8_9MICR|nr:replication factor c subunit 5 [Vairimorpha apis BRL 01]